MRIKKEVLEKILALCKEAYPNEVAGILLGTDTVNDFVIMPGEYFEASVYVKTYNIPIYPNAAGTFHSHPGPPVPSRADLDFFSKTGREHLIIGWPYNLENIRSYDSMGRRAPLQII